MVNVKKKLNACAGPEELLEILGRGNGDLQDFADNSVTLFPIK